jgi:acetyltransferase-like isoleucine patch superfamily enzyme
MILQVFRRYEPLQSSRNGSALEAGTGVDIRQSSVISAASLSFLHVVFFLVRLFVLDLLLPLFLYVAFYILRENTDYNSLTASAIYIVAAAAVLAACFLVVFTLLLRSVFRVSSIIDGVNASGSGLRGRSLLLPSRSLCALRFWMAERISSPVLWFISFLQGTELYNILLRILGAKIGRGCVILCSIDIPSLISVGDNCLIENGARLRCSQVVLLARDGTSTAVLRVGRIELGEGSYVACQATITQGVCLPANSQVECDAYLSEENCHSVPVVPADSSPRGSNSQRVLQVLVVLGFWALLLALSILLIAPWVNAAKSIEASAANAPQGTAASSSPLTVDAQPTGVTVWYYVILFEIVIHPIAIAALVVFHRCIGAPPHVATVRSAHTAPPASSSVVDVSQFQGLPIGSWAFFIHAVLRRGAIRTFGFPLYTLQSSFIPAAILRACGAKVGKRSVVFNYDYSVELQAPLQQLTIGDDCIVTTFVQLGCSQVRDGMWISHDVTIGSGCLLGNNSVVDTYGLPMADNTWVSALSHVTSSSVTPTPSHPHNALGRILCGSPTAAPLPVSPSSLLSATSPPPMHPIWIGVVTCIWAFVLAPALCPCSIEILVVFFLVINTNWSFSSMLLLIIVCEAAAFLWSTLWLLAFECLSSRIVVDGAQYPMFSAKWWAFHWCDMLRSRYISLWPQFFCDSPVFSWFMRRVPPPPLSITTLLRFNPFPCSGARRGCGGKRNHL